jgi:hypothetical protein
MGNQEVFVVFAVLLDDPEDTVGVAVTGTVVGVGAGAKFN